VRFSILIFTGDTDENSFSAGRRSGARPDADSWRCRSGQTAGRGQVLRHAARVRHRRQVRLSRDGAECCQVAAGCRRSAGAAEAFVDGPAGRSCRRSRPGRAGFPLRLRRGTRFHAHDRPPGDGGVGRRRSDHAPSRRGRKRPAAPAVCSTQRPVPTARRAGVPWPSPLLPAAGAAEPVAGAISTVSGAGVGNIPADFDAAGFVRNAKVSFIRLQAANDAGNLDDIRDFTNAGDVRGNQDEHFRTRQRDPGNRRGQH
jgi:hypothetical protein